MDEYVVSLGGIALMRDYDGKYMNERYNGWDCDHARLEWLRTVRKWDGYEGNDRWEWWVREMGMLGNDEGEKWEC